MRDLKVPESGPKRNLLDATERLVVEKGFDLVSVRDITGAIKANVAAVNYHFGSREGLMDLVMSHVMEAVDAERVEGVALARLESRGPVEKIVAAYVNSVLKAADRVGLERSFFLKLAGRVMVFPTGLMSPALAEGRKRVRDFYLQALAGVVAQMGAEDLGAAWDFFEAGLGQSLVNLRDDLEMEVQLEQWVRFGVRGLGAAGVVEKATIDQTDQTALSEQPVAAEVVEIPKPVKAAKPKAKKSDDQSMTFDF